MPAKAELRAPARVGSSALTLSVKPSLVFVIIVGEMGGEVLTQLPASFDINPVSCDTFV